MASNPRLQLLKGPSRHASRSASRSAYTSAAASPAPVTGPSYTTHTPVKDPTGKTVEYRNPDEACPVCKTDSYLNTSLRLLVSSCYHRMCESCIDRLFTLGPAPCPICGTILRKMAFIPQTFEDLVVEKEVAVRRRIAKEFNKRREDFPDLRSYNDYLEQVEDITFNLINGIDIAATEARIVAYRQENAALIELNIQRDERDVTSLQEDEARDRRDREERAAELRQLEEEERLEKAREKQDIIDSLQKSNVDAEQLIAKTRAEAAKRTAAIERLRNAPLGTGSGFGSSSRGRNAAASNGIAKDLPHVPLQDDWSNGSDLYQMRETYYDPVSESLRRDVDGRIRAGGYRIEELWERALASAVMGLEAVDLDEEEANSPSPSQVKDVTMTS